MNFDYLYLTNPRHKEDKGSGDVIAVYKKKVMPMFDAVADSLHVVERRTHETINRNILAVRSSRRTQSRNSIYNDCRTMNDDVFNKLCMAITVKQKTVKF